MKDIEFDHYSNHSMTCFIAKAPNRVFVITMPLANMSALKYITWVNNQSMRENTRSLACCVKT